MEDITVNIGKHLLNYRVSGIIKNGNKVLLHHSLKSTLYILPGGRVKEGETTEEAIKREIKEEMGQDINIVKSVSFMENLFSLDGEKYHEILVTYELEFIDKTAYKKEKIEAIEKNEKIEFIWADKNDLNNIIFEPQVLKPLLFNTPKEFKHIINVESKGKI